MPAHDFGRLRTEITMEQVLSLVEFQPSNRYNMQIFLYVDLVHEIKPGRCRLFSVSGAYHSLLLPSLPQSR